jgi:uncharacterized protein
MIVTRLVDLLQWLVRAPLLILLFGYQRFISPMIGSRCRYYPSCSQYAVESLKRFNPLKALFLIFVRVIRCNPLSAGGFDPVPTSLECGCLSDK